MTGTISQEDSPVGIQAGIDYESFPVQSIRYPPGTKVRVCFRYDADRMIDGEIVRNDVASPFIGIIRLADSRHLLMTECMYSLVKGSP